MKRDLRFLMIVESANVCFGRWLFIHSGARQDKEGGLGHDSLRRSGCSAVHQADNRSSQQAIRSVCTHIINKSIISPLSTGLAQPAKTNHHQHRTGNHQGPKSQNKSKQKKRKNEKKKRSHPPPRETPRSIMCQFS